MRGEVSIKWKILQLCHYRRPAGTGVNLSQATATIEIGDTLQLSETIVPSGATNQNVSWTSDAIGVATVSGTGLVTAISDGSETITVTTDDGVITADCDITIITSVTGVTLDISTITIIPSFTEQLTASIAPAGATDTGVTWESANTAIATVSSTGLVTAVSDGTVDISVNTDDGSYSATCTVTVGTPVSGVTLDINSFTVAFGNTEQLTETVAPPEASNTNVTWVSSNASVATVSATGLVTGVAEGSATISVTSVDGSFTDSSVANVTTDTIAPTADYLYGFYDSQTLLVGFSEDVDVVTATNISNYGISDVTPTPTISSIDMNGNQMVLIGLSNAQTLGAVLTLTVSGVEDISGNVMVSEDLECEYVAPPTMLNTGLLEKTGSMLSGEAGAAESNAGYWYDHDGDSATPDFWYAYLEIAAVPAGTLIAFETIVAWSYVEADGSFVIMEDVHSASVEDYSFPPGSYDIYVLK